MIDKKDIKPWERQPGESDKAFRFFCRYRDMGPDRSYQKLSGDINKSKMTIANMARKWKWVDRVKHYGDEIDRIKQELTKKELVEMVKRHSDHSQAIETSLMYPIKLFIDKIKNSQSNDLNGMTAKELIKIVFEVADRFPKIVDTERKSRGVPTEISKHNIDHTTKGKPMQLSMWDAFKSDVIKNMENHPEAKESLLKMLDSYVTTGSEDSGA